jgi:hypothetical protein
VKKVNSSISVDLHEIKIKVLERRPKVIEIAQSIEYIWNFDKNNDLFAKWDKLVKAYEKITN